MPNTPNTDTAIPADYDALLALFQSQQSKLSNLQDFTDQLLEQIRLSRHQHFGARSEKFSVDQLSLLAAESSTECADAGNTEQAEGLTNAPDDDAGNDIVPAHTRRKGGRQSLPPELPRIDVVYTLEGNACHCEHCQSTMTVMSERTCEQLDIVPAEVRVLRHIKQVYSCPQCDGMIKTAPMPPQILPKSMASPSTLAHIVTSKYVDGLPLHRQETQLRRLGIELTRATQSQWMIKVGQAIQPLID